MNLNCCILENEPIYIEQLSILLHQWEIAAKCSLHIDSALSPSHFFQLNTDKYDIIFIDIVLEKNMNGIEVARNLRTNSYSGDLVFLTNFQDYVFDGYPVHALDYLLKPASYEKICHCMNQVLERLAEKNFVYRMKDTIIQIPYYKILYFSSSNHCTDIITKEKVYRISQTLRNILKILPYQFTQCHRTIIVNLQHIENMNSKEIFLSNQKSIPIGRTYLDSLRKNFMSMIKNRRMLS